MPTPEDQPPRPRIPADGHPYFWATDTLRWVRCEQDDPRGIAGEGLEHPDPDPFAKT